MTDLSSQRRVAAMISSYRHECDSSSSILIARHDSPRNSKPMPQSIPATLIPGDGIGPEIMDATLAVLAALGAPFEWDTQAAGLAGVAAAGDPLPAADHRQYQTDPARPERPARNAVRRRLSILERAPAGGVQAVRQPAAGAYFDSGRPLRQHRSGGRARKPGRFVRRPRALHSDRRRPARRGDGHRREHPPRQPATAGIRFRARRRHRAARK